MSQSPLLYAVVFFALGFVSGLVVAYFIAELRSGKPPVTDRQPHMPAIPLEPQSKPQPVPLDAQIPSTPPAEQPATASNPPAVAYTRVPKIGHSQEPPKPVSINPLNALLRSVPTATLKEKPKPKSMAAEIDAILQEKLAVSPLAGRLIRLQEQPDQRLLVVVDETSFDGVSQVSDPDVRQLIQEAVAEWQRRASKAGG